MELCFQQTKSTHLHIRDNCLPILLLIYFILIIPLTSAADNIPTINSLSGDQTFLSAGGNFELGFFKPGNSTKYYIGIWYRGLPRQTVVWVANRDNPITDKYSSELKIIDGNLVLLNESKDLAWSTNMSLTDPNAVVAVLLDDGNLILRDGKNPTDQPIWQSFDFPTDTFLPGSKIGFNNRTGTKQVLTSWKNPNDPGTGLFSLELDPLQEQYLIRWNRSKMYWTSGSWNGNTFSLVPEMRLNCIYNFSYVSNENESYFTYSLYNASVLSRLVLVASGQISQMTWVAATRQWEIFWTQPRLNSEVYGVCGAFSICNSLLFPYCQCLSGFIPKSEYDWDLGDYSGGCVRKTSLQCGDSKGASVDKQSFLTISQLTLDLPTQLLPLGSAGKCEFMCLDNCSCTAYRFSNEMCGIWYNELLNIKHSEDNDTDNTIWIKLASSDLQTEKSNKKLLGIVIQAVISVVILLCSIGYFSYKKMTSTNTGNKESSVLSMKEIRILVKDSINPGKLGENDKEGVDVPFFDYKIILAATDDFSEANKLGKGGFGPVYKGMLPGGLEVAVKRLSSHSRQGLEEFKNEVVLIAKLQHRNLVKVLGYCTKGDEKILLYEYMPNKSLDTFIFDQTRCKLLDWPMRFDIISGIARGLLYLHQDSRLRIIHRDMKTSNILLDKEMNPKISDFGLARIVGGTQMEASTNRVVGTYGYMSPEYAFHGHFSVKSDVFSFGVVMLEIISGKRNTGFYHSVQALSLLGYAWNLWKEGKPLDLMDHTMVESCDSREVLKCITLGLLCVQEDPGDRPTMMNVVSVLSSESSDITSLPNPKQPAFVARKHLPASNSSSDDRKTQTNMELTVSIEEGR